MEAVHPTQVLRHRVVFEVASVFLLVPHDDVVAFVQARGLHGRGAGWVDIHLLASAVVEQVPLWTADPRLAALASEFGVAYPFLV